MRWTVVHSFVSGRLVAAATAALPPRGLGGFWGRVWLGTGGEAVFFGGAGAVFLVAYFGTAGGAWAFLLTPVLGETK